MNFDIDNLISMMKSSNSVDSELGEQDAAPSGGASTSGGGGATDNITTYTISGVYIPPAINQKLKNINVTLNSGLNNCSSSILNKSITLHIYEGDRAHNIIKQSL